MTAPPPAGKPVATPVAAATIPAYLDPKSDISTKRSAYFGLDEFSVKGDYTTLIERHGKYLASNPNLAIRVEGNADEQGSAEYNLALGQKRAEAVRRALEVYGVKKSQMEVVSWAKKSPSRPDMTKRPGHKTVARISRSPAFVSAQTRVSKAHSVLLVSSRPHGEAWSKLIVPVIVGVRVKFMLCVLD